MILNEVKKIREMLPRTGTEKLYHMLSRKGIKIGLRRLRKILRQHGLLLKTKHKSTKTTQSDKTAPKYPDLRVELVPERTEQLWVSDIMYVRVKGGFVYLCIILDAYTRKVVGWEIRKTLHKELVIAPIMRAISARETKETLIFHTDRGCQYTSNPCIDVLESAEILISQTQTGSPYDNAQAERINGISRQEGGFDQTFNSIEEAIKQSEKFFPMYNELRLHGRLKFRTPSEVHAESIEKIKSGMLGIKTVG